MRESLRAARVKTRISSRVAVRMPEHAISMPALAAAPRAAAECAAAECAAAESGVLTQMGGVGAGGRLMQSGRRSGAEFHPSAEQTLGTGLVASVAAAECAVAECAAAEGGASESGAAGCGAKGHPAQSSGGAPPPRIVRAPSGYSTSGTMRLPPLLRRRS